MAEEEASFESDPKFLALPPEAQALVRRKLKPQTPYEDDPKFQALPPAAQEIVRQKFLALGPKGQAAVIAKMGGGEKAAAGPLPKPKMLLDERGQPFVAPKERETTIGPMSAGQQMAARRAEAGAGKTGLAKVAAEEYEGLDTSMRPVREMFAKGAKAAQGQLEAADDPNRPESANVIRKYVADPATKYVGMPIAKGALSMLETLTNPKDALIILGTMGTSAGPEALSRGLAVYFGTDMGKATLESLPQAYELFKAGKPAQALSVLAQGLASGVLAGKVLKHGAEIGAPSPEMAKLEAGLEKPLEISDQDLRAEADYDIPTVIRNWKPPKPVPPEQQGPEAPANVRFENELDEIMARGPKGVEAAPEEDLSALQDVELRAARVPPKERSPQFPPRPPPPGEPGMEPLDYPGPPGELVQEAIPGELIGEPEPSIGPEHIEPFPVEPGPRQAGPAQEEFLRQPPETENLTGESPASGLEVEIARQEALLDGQRKAAAELREALPGSESATAIEEHAKETEARVKDLRGIWEQVAAALEPPTAKNPPAHPVLEAKLEAELKARGVDTKDPQAVIDFLDKEDPLGKPTQVMTVGTYPVSKASETPTSYQLDLAENRPSSELHERQHPKEAEGGPKVPEGEGANDWIVSEFLRDHNVAEGVDRVSTELADAADALAESVRAVEDAARGKEAGAIVQELRNVRTNPELEKTAGGLENTERQREIAFGEPEWIGKQGVIDKPTRREFTESGEKPETRHLAISEEDVHVTIAKVNTATRAAKRAGEVAEQLQAVAVDKRSRTRARIAVDQARVAWKEADLALARLRTTHFAAGRTVRAFGTPLAPEVEIELRRTGRMISQELRSRIREPIYNDIWNTLRDWREMGTSKALGRLGRDMGFQVTSNLFTYWSAGLDIAMNSAEIGKQVMGAAGADIYHMASGRFDFPSLRGWSYAFVDRLSPKGRAMHPRLEEMLGHKTAAGEDIRSGFGGTRGAFFHRGKLKGVGGASLKGVGEAARTVIDYASGAPLYAKGFVDRAAGNLAAQATLWSEAFRQTPKGMSKMEARAWRENFMDNPPEAALAEAESAGLKAKMDRPLTHFENTTAASTPYRLAVDIFARWPFQAGRTIAEWFGADTELIGKIRRGEPLRGDQIGRWITQSLSGYMGLYLTSKLLYDKMNFQSMDYEMDDGRSRKLSMTPAPEMLFLTAVIRSMSDKPENRQKHLENAKASLQFVSFPGAKLVSTAFFHGEPGGLLSSVIKFSGGDKNKAMDPNGMRRDIIDQLNRQIPMQATLGVLKYALDPVEREGFGGRLPLVSEALPARQSTTQGGPLIRKREVPGLGEVSTSANVPGSIRNVDPVEQLFKKYAPELMVYRGPRTPLPGVDALQLQQLKDSISRSRKGKALPDEDEIRRTWEEQLGLARESLLGPLAYRMHLQHHDLDKMPPEVARRVVTKINARANRIATGQTIAIFGGGPKPFRREKMAELTGPMVLHQTYLKAKEEYEKRVAEMMAARQK